MADIVDYAIRGLPIGCVFALLAVGLVLTYRTSGVFNLAFAAQAYTSAAVFYVVRHDHEWPLLPAAVLAIGVVAPLLGLGLERGLFRHLRGAPPIARTVTSLGLLVAIPEIVKLWIGDSAQKNPPPLWPVTRTDEWLWPREGARYVLDAGQMATVLSTVVVVVGLTILLRRSALGLRMRAVVESARMAQLAGVNADRVSMLAWALSSALAGLTGVLLAPLFAELVPLHFFTLLVAALAACVVGRLVSIPLAVLGGIGLGVLQAVLAGLLPTDSVLSTGLRPALPFVVLFLLLLLRPPRLGDRLETDPLAGVDPPPPPLVSVIRTRSLTLTTRALALAAITLGLGAGLFVLDDFWLTLVTSGLVLAVVLLSFTVLTGMGGMVSLCQATFAAIGAFSTAQIVDATGAPVVLAMLAGTVVAAAVGGLLAVPLLRLDGIYLTLATLAFALMFQSVLVPLDWVSGGSTPIEVPRPLIGSIDLADDHAFFVFAALCVALVGAIVVQLRQATTGRFLDAVRGSEAAAVAVGISPLRQRVVAFALAAGIAGFGGGLIASWTGEANYDRSFQFLYGLVWVVLVVTMGARSVQAAVFGGLAFYLIPELVERLPLIPDDWASGLSVALFGLGALTYARHPEGIIEANSSAVIGRIQRLLQRRSSRHPQQPALSIEGAGAP
ncbi:MAG TPA: ABC transporter permease [Acidimicrobiales bacterium]|jgi:branched-subunit amino acid ABC-type transport system permease component